jgi:hypothetical protein
MFGQNWDEQYHGLMWEGYQAETSSGNILSKHVKTVDSERTGCLRETKIFKGTSQEEDNFPELFVRGVPSEFQAV